MNRVLSPLASVGQVTYWEDIPFPSQNDQGIPTKPRNQAARKTPRTPNPLVELEDSIIDQSGGQSRDWAALGLRKRHVGKE